ncbi:hypothetical protein H4Q26_010654 [Puccinia striiformis f. sp. tritici PST-130]|nr:hypothetical protein H4Q26_010654 [Puccinia striiformis f. sp. tritici PST-130]
MPKKIDWEWEKQFFKKTTDEEGPTTEWICRYCSERVLINWRRHSRLPTHQTRISECDPDLDGTTRGNVSEKSRPSTVNVANDSSDKESNLGFEENVLDQDGLLQEIEDTPMDINVSTEEAPTIDMFEAAKENGPKTSNLGDIDWMDLIPDTLDQILHEEEEEYEHVCQFDEENREDDIENETGESGKDSPWFPFWNKNILKIVFDLNLPGWEALRRERKKIREICSVSLNEKTLSTGKTCFALSAKEIIKQELLNPLVNQHMEYFPQDSEGQNIFKLSQSQRWLSELSPKTCVQMCTSNNKQYYIFEPVQLRNSVDIVIPIFFYKKHDRTFSKCVRPEISSKSAGSELVLQIDSHLTFNDPRLISFPIEELDLIYPDICLKSGRKLADFCNDCITELDCGIFEQIPLPNPWRTKANKQIIRHVPISLYCDDTSGNVSKQYNKHMLYYFTLSGLPPRLANQEYNCHFLSTSNTAGALELGQQVVPELNEMVREGYDAYNAILEKDVLVMTPVLAFLGDSPMHAEITNTPVPSSSLNPCRFCDLCASSKNNKTTMEYLTRFLQKSPHGTNCPNQLQHWPKMKTDSKKLWDVAKAKKSEKKTDKQSILYGVRDQINRHFAAEIYQLKKQKKKLTKNKEPIPQNMKCDIPQHILDIEKNNPDDLFNPFLELEGFDGLKHTPVEILHVFLLGMVKYLFRDFMSHLKPDEKQELVGLWRSFNTDSLNIPSLKPMGLWINKPKFHMLLHLPASIRRYGPASLFATEKFESYNGILRNVSVHSNRQSPGRDIAITFSNYNSFRHIFSGGLLYDQKKKQFFKPTSHVTDIFTLNANIQISFGYNHLTASKKESYPSPKKKAVLKTDSRDAPEDLRQHYRYHSIQQICELDLNQKQVLKKGSFVLFNLPLAQQPERPTVGKIDSIWCVQKPQHQSRYLLHLTILKKKGVNDWYQMQEFKVTSKSLFVNTTAVASTLNFQHNCHDGDCTLTKTKTVRIERIDSVVKALEVTHGNRLDYILNTCSLHAINFHQKTAKLEFRTIEPLEWLNAMHEGLAIWKSNKKKGKTVIPITSAISRVDPSFLV